MKNQRVADKYQQEHTEEVDLVLLQMVIVIQPATDLINEEESVRSFIFTHCHKIDRIKIC